MLINYLKFTLRKLRRNKLISAINIFGLGLGMACCFVILMYINDEKSYDQWLPDAELIHRVSIDIINKQGDHLLFAPVSGTLAPVLKDYPQVEHATRILSPFAESVPVSVSEEKVFYEKNFCWADQNVFELFQFKFLAGLPATALQAPNDVVLTREMAEKYFSVKEDFDQVLNWTLKRDTTEYRVTAVIENIPHNTSFKPDFIASFKEFETQEFVNNWHATIFYTFVKLKKGTDVVAFEQQIRNVADKYVAEEIKTNEQEYAYFLQPLTDIHLNSNLRYEFSKNNSYRYVQLFGLVALFILLLACINFVNLTTAHASKRAKEVGVRKTTGAQRSQLIGQFLTEALVTSFFASVIALMLVGITLPSFNLVADKQFILMDLWRGNYVWLLLGMAGIVGVLAGAYPAFAFSKFKPVEVLRGSFSSKTKGKSQLRSGLVIVQFSISVALIVATVVLSKQVQFLKQQNLGFNKDQLLVLNAPSNLSKGQNYATIRTELSKLPGVNNVCVTGIVPGKSFGNNLVALKGDQAKATDMQLMQIDENFLETYQIQLLAGRNLSEKIPDDLNQNILINESALPFYGWSTPEEALGNVFDGGWGTIVGIVKDFHFNSLHQEVLPLEMYFDQRSFSYVTLDVSSSAIEDMLPALKSEWSSLLPGTPFEFSFLDETFNRQYLFEDRLLSLFKVFGILAIFIACLGLFGMAAFTAEQRNKEIGIRKILGATTVGLVGLLSKDFLKLVIIALIIASPLAYYFMENWLQGFAYRIDIQWWVFALAGIVALGVALITVGFQSIKAALANPINSLKNE